MRPETEMTSNASGASGESRKRILFICPQPFIQWRGSPFRVRYDVQVLAELGFDVDLLTLPLGTADPIPGVRVIRVPNIFGVRNLPIGPSLPKLLFDGLLLLWAFSLALCRRYHAIHCVEDGGMVGAVVAGIMRTRLVFEMHSDPASYHDGFMRNLVMRVYSRLERWVMRRADAIIGTGPGLVSQIRAITPNKPVFHIFDQPSSQETCDPQTVSELRKRLQRTEHDVLITYVGSFAVYQGIDLLFDSMPIVARRKPNARFVIIGGSADEIEARKEQISEAGAAESSVFVGKIAPHELPNNLSASDILVSTRIAGVNTPLKLLDYMKAGRAIVATDVDANRFILDEHTALLVKPEAQSMAEGICSLVDDRSLREELGRKGRRLLDEKYSMPEFKKRLAECYQSLAACLVVLAPFLIMDIEEVLSRGAIPCFW